MIDVYKRKKKITFSFNNFCNMEVRVNENRMIIYSSSHHCCRKVPNDVTSFLLILNELYAQCALQSKNIFIY